MPDLIKFETIGRNIERAKVFGGWIIKAYSEVIHKENFAEIECGLDWRIAMTFVPDPNHEWIENEHGGISLYVAQ